MQTYRIAVADEEIDNLRRRLGLSRWPTRETAHDWSQGTPLDEVRSLCDYWATGYDWRRREDRLNLLPHFTTEVEGLQVHFVHLKSGRPDAVPLLLTHGWPGAFTEYVEVAERLVVGSGDNDPVAFDLVIPSLPGYAFSGKPTSTGWGVTRVAQAWAQLMTQLGYDRFGAVGSDWGTSVTAALGHVVPERLIGLLLMPPQVAPDQSTMGDLTPEEKQSLVDREEKSRTGMAYSAVHSTRPQSIGYALDDSAVGLCGWMLEKFWDWTQHDGDLYSVIDRDRILDILSIYWFTRSGTSSIRMYWESFPEVWSLFTSSSVATVGVPVGGAIFPGNSSRPSRRWAEQRFTNIVYWREHERGGHFPGLEQPHLVVEDIRGMFGSLA